MERLERIYDSGKPLVQQEPGQSDSGVMEDTYDTCTSTTVYEKYTFLLYISIR